MIMMMSLAIPICCAALLGQATDGNDRPLLAGKAFALALEQPFAAAWENVGVRTIARRIEAARGVSILLDRRIDPSREHSLAANGESLREFVERLAQSAGGAMSSVGNTLYVGPPASAAKLRTLVALRQKELTAEGNGIPRTRRHDVAQPELFRWDDLSRPADLVRMVAARHELKVDGIELVPHDLWASADLPQATSIEALSLILVQFDLTFEWLDDGGAIRLVPAPERVFLERRHLPLKGQTSAAAITEWREQFPGVEGRVAGSEVVVQGTVEQHEAIERQRFPSRAAAASPAPAKLKPLKLERYTLKMKDKPVRALLLMLAEPAHGQLKFEYDGEALRQAGVDLDQRVTFEVKAVTIEELLKAALDPLKLEFDLQDRSVRLQPARR